MNPIIDDFRLVIEITRRTIRDLETFQRLLEEIKYPQANDLLGKLADKRFRELRADISPK